MIQKYVLILLMYMIYKLVIKLFMIILISILIGRLIILMLILLLHICWELIMLGILLVLLLLLWWKLKLDSFHSILLKYFKKVRRILCFWLQEIMVWGQMVIMEELLLRKYKPLSSDTTKEDNFSRPKRH